jgi:hypothetical protein
MMAMEIVGRESDVGVGSVGNSRGMGEGFFIHCTVALVMAVGCYADTNG